MTNTAGKAGRPRICLALARLTLACSVTFFGTPVMAEVIESSDVHFVTRDVAVVEADLKATWLALISPARWWSSEHTWSADAANLRLMPQAGGCFCEMIPEVEDANRITLEGSVEHMRVIQAYPERALRMQGALGPLQSEPVTGVLTIALTEAEGGGTRIVWEYAVGGHMRYEVPTISGAIDGLMTLQLAGLANLLGRVEGPELPAEADPEAPPEEGNDNEAAAIEPEPVIGTAMDKEAGPSVDDAFGDLSGG
jgi:uncharacterized protein YndB with AHSA1/START domain